MDDNCFRITVLDVVGHFVGTSCGIGTAVIMLGQVVPLVNVLAGRRMVRVVGRDVRNAITELIKKTKVSNAVKKAVGSTFDGQDV